MVLSRLKLYCDNSLAKILDEEASDEPFKENEKKTHSLLLLSLSDGVLHKVADEWLP